MCAPPHNTMNLDNTNAFTVLMTERVKINASLKNVYVEITSAGDPVDGGAINARQNGNQFIMRVKKIDYPAPAVHDKLLTTNFGTLRTKQWFAEGEMWAVMATGATKGDRDV